MIAGNGEYGPGIGTGYTGEKSGAKKCVKNRKKSEIVHECGREKSKLSFD